MFMTREYPLVTSFNDYYVESCFYVNFKQLEKIYNPVKVDICLLTPDMCFLLVALFNDSLQEMDECDSVSLALNQTNTCER